MGWLSDLFDWDNEAAEEQENDGDDDADSSNESGD